MTRGAVPGLPTPHPLGSLLPGVYQEDDLTQRFMAGLDEVLAPVLLTLDCLDACLDPRLAPDDFVRWLATWVGVELDETWPQERRRALVRAATWLHARRGTRPGLVRYLRLITGLQIEVEESGGARWSTDPGSPPPGSDTPRLVVRVPTDDPSRLDMAGLDRAVREARPAGMPYEIRVVARGSARPGGTGAHRA